MSEGFSDGLFRGFLVGAMVGALAVAACGCVPDAEAQAVQRLETGRFRNEAFPSFESELRAMIDADQPSHVKIAPDRVVAYRIGAQWFQAGVEQCIPEGKP